MGLRASFLLLVTKLEWQGLCTAERVGVRTITATGQAGHVGLEIANGQIGTVCELNEATVDVACRQLGYDYGIASPSSCASVCGAAGS